MQQHSNREWMKLSLKVVASDFDGSYNVESETVGVPFVPGAVGLALAVACINRGKSSGSQQTGFQSFIPRSSPQPSAPIHSVLKGGSPTPSLNPSGLRGTPMVSMATPSSTEGGFRSLSPQTSLKRTTPTSVMSRGYSPSTTYRPLYSQS